MATKEMVKKSRKSSDPILSCSDQLAGRPFKRSNSNYEEVAHRIFRLGVEQAIQHKNDRLGIRIRKLDG